MEAERRRPISRTVRRERKYRGCFRCEWCNRWTQVPIDEYWKRLHIGVKGKKRDAEEALAQNKKNVKFFCKRERCIAQRD